MKCGAITLGSSHWKTEANEDKPLGMPLRICKCATAVVVNSKGFNQQNAVCMWMKELCGLTSLVPSGCVEALANCGYVWWSDMYQFPERVNTDPRGYTNHSQMALHKQPLNYSEQVGDKVGTSHKSLPQMFRFIFPKTCSDVSRVFWILFQSSKNSVVPLKVQRLQMYSNAWNIADKSPLFETEKILPTASSKPVEGKSVS